MSRLKAAIAAVAVTTEVVEDAMTVAAAVAVIITVPVAVVAEDTNNIPKDRY